MFAMGFIEEVQGLLDAGYTSGDPGMLSIGYREVITYLSGENNSGRDKSPYAPINTCLRPAPIQLVQRERSFDPLV